MDLLLHEEILVLNEESRGVIFDPSTSGPIDIMSLLRKHGEADSLKDKPYTLEPNRLVIGKTLETIKLPLHIAGRIEGRSSLARFGLAVHVTAPTVLAGFSGCLYLEIHSVGYFRINLQKGMKIAQLVLERTGLPPNISYEGQFQSQT